MPRILPSSLVPSSLALLIALAYALLVHSATTWGGWGYSDTAAYIAAARNLAAGLGLRLPDAAGVLHLSVLTPPFYAWLIALGASTGLDPLAWARGLGILLAFLFPAGLGLLAARAAARPWFAPVLALLLVCFPPLFTNAASIMSEQLFFCLGFTGLLLLLTPDDPPSVPRLVLSAALIGLSALTRYLGAAFIAAAGALLWLILANLPLRRRLLHAALYILGAAIPIALWLAWTLLATRTVGARTLVAAPEILTLRWDEFLRATIDILSTWIPYGARGAFILTAQGKLLVLLLLWIALAAWSWREAPPRALRLLLSAIVFCLAYLVFLALSYLFASIRPDLIPRMFSPLWPAICLALVTTAWMLAVRLRRQSTISNLAYAGLGLLVLLNLVYFSPQIAEMVAQGKAEGVGYTARIYRQSPAFDLIRARLENRPIISDEPGLVLLYTGRGAYPWEEWVQGNLRAAADQPPPGQGEGRLHEQMRSGAALVIFPDRVAQEYGPESAALLARWTGGLAALYRGPEAEILIMR